MSKYKDGEYIPLVWEGRPDAYYIKGNVSREDGINILIGEGVIDNATDVGLAVHVYGRWSAQGDAPEGCTTVLREYLEPGRGRFSMTGFNVSVSAKEL